MIALVVGLLLLIGIGVIASEEEEVDSDVAYVCERITTDNLASAPDRVTYLRGLQKRARDAGLGLGPNVTLAADHMEAGNHREAAAALGRAQEMCERVQ
jgi:hypothetical protein